MEFEIFNFMTKKCNFKNIVNPFSSSTPASDQTNPKPTSLSFDQIDVIEKERSEKDETLQRICACRESKKKSNPRAKDTTVSRVKKKGLMTKGVQLLLTFLHLGGHLDLSICGLEGEIPNELGNLTKLDTLFLQTNQLVGLIPSQLSNLVNLKNLDRSE
ncbi:hypothetical protein L1887_32440 [Cichorium endivia]|nr:hypothetical protein L1887_32440 [Cichorium endivia]